MITWEQGLFHHVTPTIFMYPTFAGPGQLVVDFGETLVYGAKLIYYYLSLAFPSHSCCLNQELQSSHYSIRFKDVYIDMWRTV